MKKEIEKKVSLSLLIRRFIGRLFLQHKVFTGSYADILIERKRFIRSRNIFIVGSNWNKKGGGSKANVKEQMVFYVENHFITRWAGFCYTTVHLENV